MSRICHAHCPDESGGFLAVLAAVLAVVLAVVIAQIVASLFWAIIALASVLGATGIAHLAYVLRRDRPGRVIPASPAPARSLPPARRSAALPAPMIRALPASSQGMTAPVLRGHVSASRAADKSAFPGQSAVERPAGYGWRGARIAHGPGDPLLGC